MTQIFSRKFVLPALAIVGLILGIRTVVSGAQKPPTATPIAPPPQAPFERYVAGSGIVEPESENIAIATTVGGVVSKLYVQVGDVVEQGAPLFEIDDRELRAEYQIRAGALSVARAEYDDAKSQFDLWKSVADKRAVSVDEMIRRQNAVAITAAKLKQAEAGVNAANIDLDRLIVRAPIAGRLLQVKVRLGEYAPPQNLDQPLMILGSVRQLHLRVDVDESDSWRVKPGMPARAFVRGNNAYQTALEFVRFEPYVVPKRSLTGQSTERVDTRVLQVIYRFNPADLPVFVGQLMDVYIQADADLDEPMKGEKNI